MRLKVILFSIFIGIAGNVSAQCPVADFNIQTSCAGQSLQITNLSTGGQRYEWEFNPGFFGDPGVQVNDTTLPLSFAGDLNVYVQNDTAVAFITGKADGNIYRLTYANGIEAGPTSVENFGNFGSTFYQPSDLQLFNDSGDWFAIVVDYGLNALGRIKFGNSLFNSPDSAVILLNNTVSNLTTPWSVEVARDSSGNVFALAGNFTAGSMTLFDFGNTVRNIPVASPPIPVDGESTVLDLILARSCGEWHAFIAGYSSSNIVRADFGNSLTNSPVFSTIISDGSPSDLALVRDSSHWKLLYTNYSGHDIKRYDLGTDFSSTPVLLGSEQPAGTNPKGISIIREGMHQYAMVLYTGSNNLKALKYEGATVANISFSTDSLPQGIVFNQGGSYPVTLNTFDSYGNSNSKTVLINITDAPQPGFYSEFNCEGDVTQFYDTSLIGSGVIVSWEWDFGDGDTSAAQHPAHSYNSPGTYVVTLKATGNTGCANITSKNVVIGDRPVADFQAPSGCSMTMLQITDQSSVASGSIQNWQWQFGNGDTSTAQNPAVTYSSGGSYPVELIVTSDKGCTDTLTTNVTVNDKPLAGFDFSNTCVNQLVQFTNQTTLSGATVQSYSWDFGDGNTDTVQDPSHTFPPVTGNYDVGLMVVADNGCIDTITREIRISNIPTVDFSISGTTFCEGVPVQFTDLSSVLNDTISQWLWDFGDGGSDTVQSPEYVFTSAGQHTISLVSYSPSSCPGPVYQQTIQVLESPQAIFTSDGYCVGSGTQFTDYSIAPAGETITGWSWTFPPADSSGFQNPLYFFNSDGEYLVGLTVTASNGCYNIDSGLITMHNPPVSNFSFSNACTGSPVQFNNLSSCDSGSVITAYAWNFGDFMSGANNHSTLANPGHTYNNQNTYYASLITTTNIGCTDTLLDTIDVNQSPAVNFTYSPTCYGELMSFFNPGSPSDSAYQWNFGDNQINQLQEPAHFYAFPGSYNVTLTVWAFSGCSSTSNRQVSVSPIPIADFVTKPACINNTYQFLDSSRITTGSIVNWSWQISSLGMQDSVQSPEFVFTDTGNYSVKLTVTSDIGCTNSVQKNISVHPIPVANFSFDPQFGNPPLHVQFNDYSTGADLITWNFGDNTAISNLPQPSHVYQDTGLFTISQIVSSSYGCMDTMTKNIYVIRPILDIAITGDSSYFEGDYFHIVARISNQGTRDISHVIMEARLENGSTIRENLNEIIPNGPGGIRTYDFHAAFLVPRGSNFNYYCIKAIDPDGQPDDVPQNNEKCFNRTNGIVLAGPYPNPFSAQTLIRAILPFSEELKIKLYDLKGNLVKDLYEGTAPKGLTDVWLKADGLKADHYMLFVWFNNETITRKVIMIRD